MGSAAALSRFWRRQREWAMPALLILPAVVLFMVVIIASSLQSLWISLHEWDGLGVMQWVGLENYHLLFDDPQFYVSLKNNVIWLVVFMLAPPSGLAIALLVNQPMHVVVPLVRPALAALAILLFTFIWNDYFWAVVLTISDSVKPVTAGLANLMGQYVAEWNLISAATMIVAIPPVLMFFAMQKHFISGLTMGAVKG